RALRPDALSRARAEGAPALPAPVLPDGRVGLPVGRADHRHSLLPRRPQAGATRTDRRRPRGRARDPDVPPPRGRARLQLRLPPPRGSRVARAVWPVQPAVPREVPAGALRPALRPAPGGGV